VETALDALGKSRSAIPGLAGEIDAASTRVRALSGVRAAANPHNAWAFPPKDVNSLLFLGGELDNLLLAVDGSDAAPSADAKKGFDALVPMIDTALTNWEQIKTRELKSLNAKLKAAGQAEIKVD
jgi:hypothetical protein